MEYLADFTQWIRGLLKEWRALLAGELVAIALGVIPSALGVEVPPAVWGVLVSGGLLYAAFRLWRRERRKEDRMISALALVHAPDIEVLYPISRDGKRLTLETVRTWRDFEEWRGRVDEWWKGFLTARETLRLVERIEVDRMEKADMDGRSPSQLGYQGFEYVELWRNVLSTSEAIDTVLRSREQERRDVRALMTREGFDEKLLPPHFK